MDEVNQIDINQADVNSTSAPSAPTGGGADISKTTITVLVLLTLMISVIGTWTVLNEVNSVKVTTQQSKTSGVVSLNLQSASTQQQPVAASGRVVFGILKS
jgi:hypothetical protein